MIYLKNFQLLSEKEEYHLLLDEKRRIFNTIYPFHLFALDQPLNFEFEPITIFYGDNGCGKSTLLNIIALKLQAERKTTIDKGIYFKNYVSHCSYRLQNQDQLREIKMITSEDIFDYLIDIQAINSSVHRKKDELCEEFLNYKYQDSSNFIHDYEQLKNKVDANKKTMSAYVRDHLKTNNIISQSNGETALLFWEKEIQKNAIYILDEPENSLSATNQLKLKKFIEDSVRFFNCQFIISTHSPFLLHLNHAIIYDLNDFCKKEWSQLDSIQTYYQFFKERKEEFEK